MTQGNFRSFGDASQIFEWVSLDENTFLRAKNHVQNAL